MADTVGGRAIRGLLPQTAIPWIPELFFVECGTVLRRWDVNGALAPAQISRGIDDLMRWPLRVVQVRALFTDAWRLPANLTFSDAVYVALAEHLGAELRTDDHKLVATPNLSIRTLHLSRP